jgi:hypothetical protein
MTVYKTAVLLPSFIFVLLFSANRVLPLGWQTARKMVVHPVSQKMSGGFFLSRKPEVT